MEYQAIAKRKIQLFDLVTIHHFGTLWKIRDIFWRRELNIKPKKKRLYHPGFCIFNGKYQGLTPFIPMLFGSSQRSWRGFCVRGFCRRKGADYQTWFGGTEKIVAQSGIQDFFSDEPNISVNTDKPVATQEEIRAAHDFLRAAGKEEAK